MTKLTMLLAQAQGQPQGDLNDKLEIRVALTPNAQLDAAAHAEAGAPWIAVRERPGHDRRESELVRLDEGWALQSLRGDDDPLWGFESHVLRPGELVRLVRPGGEEMLYRIVAIEGD